MTVKSTENKRNAKGQFIIGNNEGNRKGRPKIAIAEQFRNNPKAKSVLDKIIEVANTLNTDAEHKDAVTCARIVSDKIIPTLKAQEIAMEIKQMPEIIVIE